MCLYLGCSPVKTSQCPRRKEAPTNQLQVLEGANILREQLQSRGMRRVFCSCVFDVNHVIQPFLAEKTRTKLW